MTAKREWGKVLDIIGKSLGLGIQPYMLFFSGSFIEDNHVCIVLVFLNIPAEAHGSSGAEILHQV
jgi:hypothetical protein